MRMRSATRLVLGAVIFVAVAGLAATRRKARQAPVATERQMPAPLAVQRTFKAFCDSTGARLADTLFKLGFHGGYSWDEKSGPVRPNLVPGTDSATVSDSTRGVFEGTLSLDFHHDVQAVVPPVVTLRFVTQRGTPKWVLLTTDSYPEDPTPELTLQAIRKLPAELHEAVLSQFLDHADAFEYWQALERGKALTP